MTDSTNPAGGPVQPDTLGGGADQAATAPAKRKKGQRRTIAEGCNLLPKQQRFVDEYLKDWDGKAAAIRAGYTEPGAYSQACRMLQYPAVQKIIDIHRAELAKRQGSLTLYTTGHCRPKPDRLTSHCATVHLQHF